MSVGKKSLARVANVTSQKAEIVETFTLEDEKKILKDAEATVAEFFAAEEVSPKVDEEKTPPPEKERDEKFKNVQVGDNMPMFLL